MLSDKEKTKLIEIAGSFALLIYDRNTKDYESIPNFHKRFEQTLLNLKESTEKIFKI